MALAGTRHAVRVRRSKRAELARQTTEWFEETTPEQRGPVVVGIVLLGLVALPLMLITVPVLAVLVVRLRRRARIGRLQRVALAGLAGVHAVFWFLRWELLRRLRRAMAEVGGEPGRGPTPVDP